MICLNTSLSQLLLSNTIQATNVILCYMNGNVNIYQRIIKGKWKSFHTASLCRNKEYVSKPLRNVKPKAEGYTLQHFIDIKKVRTIGGKGGDGDISFLRLFINDRAGPHGGDGGSGGHVIFEVSKSVKDLSGIESLIKAPDGEKGYPKDCFGKSADHKMIKVPLGTIVRNTDGTVLADLNAEAMMFIAARGGAGGHGNAFFKSDTVQSPEIAEYGAQGEEKEYILETQSMAHIGLIGVPNAGKSTLLRAISRARPKVASYPFTTLKPHVGIVQYDDYEQVAVADLPGLIPDSHKNKGLGITFLKHAERCGVLLFILDVTCDKPWENLEVLMHEINEFNKNLLNRTLLIVANKIDLPGAEENLKLLKEKTDLRIIPVSAKMGTNISFLLKEIRILYDTYMENRNKSDHT